VNKHKQLPLTKLSPEQRDKAGRDLSRLIHEHDIVEHERQDAAKDYRDKLTAIRTQIARLAALLDDE